MLRNSDFCRPGRCQDTERAARGEQEGGPEKAWKKTGRDGSRDESLLQTGRAACLQGSAKQSITAPLRLSSSQCRCNTRGRLHLEANIPGGMASLPLKYLFILNSEPTQNSTPSCCPLGRDIQHEGASSIHLTLCKG